MPTDEVHARGNPDRLRHAIDRGRTADKVDFPDPAAAPLGTDDEAAGMPPSPAETEAALAQEAAPRLTGHPSGRLPDAAGRHSAPWLLAFVIVGLVLLGATGVFILR